MSHKHFIIFLYFFPRKRKVKIMVHKMSQLVQCWRSPLLLLLLPRKQSKLEDRVTVTGLVSQVGSSQLRGIYTARCTKYKNTTKKKSIIITSKKRKLCLSKHLEIQLIPLPGQYLGVKCWPPPKKTNNN